MLATERSTTPELADVVVLLLARRNGSIGRDPGEAARFSPPAPLSFFEDSVTGSDSCRTGGLGSAPVGSASAFMW